MEIWEHFEINSTVYLNQKFAKYATFTRLGGPNSSLPDIKVETIKGDVFYIEAKHCPAQSGQFVLLPNLQTMKFDYSSRNINMYNHYAELIMNEMNKDFEAFKEAGTAGKDIVLLDDQTVFSGWIISFYKNKGVKLVITNEFKLFPIDDFAKVFTIAAKYRIKRSGSNDVGKLNMLSTKNYIKSNYTINSIREDKSKLYIESSINLHDCRFINGGYEYMFSRRTNEYEIRKLSNTFNANVIFSIDSTHKSDYNFLSDDDFISYL